MATPLNHMTAKARVKMYFDVAQRRYEAKLFRCDQEGLGAIPARRAASTEARRAVGRGARLAEL
jgi:hypothetical protein